jgi:hypothetical protein
MDPSRIGHRAGHAAGRGGADSAQTHLSNRKVATMSVPGSNPIQFPSTQNAEMTVDQVTDPNGDPADVIDVDLGFSVSGKVLFPNWLSGKGRVAIYADELGGPFDTLILSTEFDITAIPTDPPALTEYDWTVNYPADNPGGASALPDPSPGSQLYHLAAVFTFNGQPSDIAAFVEMGPYLIN